MADTTTLEKPEVTIAVEDSSAISGLRYQADNQKLFVQFQSGEKEYPYYNVPPQVFEEFAQAESKGKFFHAEIRDQYPPTPEQAFREELKQTLEAAGIDPHEPVKIQMGRDVVFKGDIDSPDVNKLSESRLATLSAALDVAANGSETEGTSRKGVVNIDVGDRRVFRMVKGEGEVNDLQPPRVDRELQEEFDFAQSLEALTKGILERSEDSLLEHLEEKGLTVGFYEDFDGYRDAWNATTDWVVDQAKTDTTLSAFLEEFPGKLASVSSKLLEQEFDPELALQEPEPAALPAIVEQSPVPPQDQVPAPADTSPQQGSLPVGTPEVVPAPTPSTALPFNPAIAKRELQEFDQRLNPPEPNPMQAIMAKASRALPEKLTVPAAAIALKELYSSDLSATAQQWAGTALNKLNQVAGLVPEDLTERGLKATQKAISQVAAIPKQLRERQMADAVVKLTKTFGALEDEGERKVFGVDTENYKIQVRNTNQYSVSNAAGKEILSFKQTPFGPKYSQCDPNALEQKDLLRAGKQITPELVKQSAEEIVAKLGNLAPAGKRAEAREHQEARIVDRISQMMDRAAAKGEQKVEGKHYRIEQHEDGSRSLTRNQSQSPSLKIAPDGKTVDSFLQADDRERLLQKPQPQKAQKRDRETVGMEV